MFGNVEHHFSAEKIHLKVYALCRRLQGVGRSAQSLLGGLVVVCLAVVVGLIFVPICFVLLCVNFVLWYPFL